MEKFPLACIYDDALNGTQTIIKNWKTEMEKNKKREPGKGDLTQFTNWRIKDEGRDPISVFPEEVSFLIINKIYCTKLILTNQLLIMITS